MNTNYDEELLKWNIEIIHFPISREPSIIKDICAVFEIRKLIKQGNFDIVHSISPKSGLISSIACYLIKSQICVHTFTGQVWANFKGYKRLFFITLDRLICTLNKVNLVDSPSQKHYLIQNGIGTSTKLIVLGKGSICGVDTNRFVKNEELSNKLRKEYHCENKFTILFLGRLKKDKGVLDLVNAVNQINNSKIFLIIVGKDEENIKEIVRTYRKSKCNILFVDETPNPERYISISDIICLPSYREGFGNVIIEAASMGVPSIVSNIYGLKDAVDINKTGLNFEVGNINHLTKQILKIYGDRELLSKMQINCPIFVKENFESIKLSEELDKTYKWLLNEKF